MDRGAVRISNHVAVIMSRPVIVAQGFDGYVAEVTFIRGRLYVVYRTIGVVGSIVNDGIEEHTLIGICILVARHLHIMSASVLTVSALNVIKTAEIELTLGEGHLGKEVKVIGSFIVCLTLIKV